mmetsp:Transcript_5066/g.7741  ORF Transcript_5066/g.7741 Transcript_5066/m.7741 type:complete len:120 (+) Transcript_5066:85-444(+)
MGRQRVSRRRTSKNKEYKKQLRTKNRPRDIDQIQDDLKIEQETGEKKTFEIDDDLAGLGQYYCTPCGRHFIDQKTLDSHCQSKLHKRRLKDVAQKQYTKAEAEWASGKTKEILPPAHAT